MVMVDRSGGNGYGGQRIVEDIAESLKEGWIPAAFFNDAELHRLELERIFARSWVFVGHESEVSSPGDYVLRYIGEDPFIFVRDEEGKLHVLFDACRHRGAQVCRAEKGNASHFRCPYHGWTYKNNGELIGIPAFKDAYGGLDKKSLGLLPAPHVESLHGFVFASLEPEVPSLDEHLGQMRFYLDMIFGITDWEVVGEPHRWVVDANWKIGADNFAGDDYHTLFLHKSMWDVGTIQIPARENMKGYHIQVDKGHTLSFSMDPNPDAPPPYYWGYPDEVVRDCFHLDRLNPTQRELARRARVCVGSIFPNLSYLTFPVSYDAANAPPTGIFTIRQWQPRGPGSMELWSWILIPKGASEENRRASYRSAMSTFSSSGIFEQDDTEPWTSITRTGGTVLARKNRLKLNYQMGLDGIGSARPISDFPGPGLVYYPRYEEGVQRFLWSRWVEYMTAE